MMTLESLIEYQTAKKPVYIVDHYQGIISKARIEAIENREDPDQIYVDLTMTEPMYIPHIAKRPKDIYETEEALLDALPCPCK